MKRVLLVILLLVLFPTFTFAQEGLIPCDGVNVKCDFLKLIELAGNVIDFLITVSTFLAVISFMYAGFLYLTAGGNEGKIKQAHSIFWKVLWGFIIILSAWLIVELIIGAFLKDEYSLFAN